MVNSVIFTEEQLANYTQIIGWAFISAVAEHFKIELTEEDSKAIIPKAQELALFHLHTPSDRMSVN